MTGAPVDVLVAGGGPAGSATASHLARRGYSVLLVDRAQFPREKPCGEYQSPGVVQALERLGALDLVAAYAPCWPAGMQITTPSRSFRLTYADNSGTSALGIPRRDLDRALIDHAARSGVEILEKTRALHPLFAGDRVSGLRVRSAAGEQDIPARFVVVADGLHSTISRSLGLDTPVRWPRRLGLVARYEGVFGLETFGQMHAGRGIYCGLAQVGHGMVNAGLVVPMGHKSHGEPVAEYFERQVQRLPGIAAILGQGRRVTPVRGVGPLARRVRRVSGPGYVLVGDAAGFFDPFTGEGVHRALRGAEIAAEAIDRALTAGNALPYGYEHARRDAFSDKERVCQIVQLFLSTMPTFEYVSDRIARRQDVNTLLAGVLGDYQPAGPALKPRAMWNLLRP